MHTITVRHNFETGHRLPHLPGKCQSLHGHSWWVAVTLRATELPEDKVVVEFGTVKRLLREWIDDNLDHGVMLGKGDPLAELLAEYGNVYVMPNWPTVEAVAELLGKVARDALAHIADTDGVQVAQVTVTETHLNQATWQPPTGPTSDARR
ncbi:6-pyruvoyltetrahydropterin/6-carboxytetrahydropterin synthase [Kibdelosporangium banguiense]|uniref:6-carboxy-5,6,7,8-tetrahydropterin synthase n=1 Tax=Kibdelosporangium banguiense TaxID=1365924 RepID=A0ABS4TLR1_9PSEU|nr:6-carboxytetrahydropterin synthase [Kibdelosporangium banguiense]MBP2325347.1 6-pyruvoyltetrahydropterin/6-carboxytetrahydropterin synthase [Kibdelosporangium banguiense]